METKEQIASNVKTTTTHLLQIAKNLCTNRLSENIAFVVDHITETKIEKMSIPLLLNTEKFTIEKIIGLIFEQQKLISWVDLDGVLYSDSKQTIIRCTFV